MKIRFLPIMIFFSIVILLSKVDNIIDTSKNFLELFLINDLNANSDEGESKHSESASEGDKEEGKSDGADSDAKKRAAKPLPAKISSTKPTEFDCKKSDFSDIDINILQNLSKRREDLDKRESEIVNKEAVLGATEQKMDLKLQDLKNLKNEVTDLLKQYNDKEDMKISSLVKIYENMKAKDAAKIFESLDMPLLLQVLDKMKEAKSAPILAQMNPTKASDITAEYAKQKKMN